MPDDAQSSEGKPKKPHSYEERGPFFYDEPDPLLDFFVGLANDAGLRAGITLFVGGATISGDLVGYRDYHEAIAELLRNASGNVGEAFGEVYAKHLVEEPPDDDDDDVGVEMRDRNRFVHLLNGRVYSSAGPPIPVDTGVPMRVRMSRVDGWTLGVLSHS